MTETFFVCKLAREDNFSLESNLTSLVIYYTL